MDEDLSWRVAGELRRRGYDATSAVEWGIAARSGVPSVLITFDNKMARVHADAVRKRKTTLAVLDNRAARDGRSREEYAREVIHRWAHRMARQAPAERFIYRLNGRTRIEL